MKIYKICQDISKLEPRLEWVDIKLLEFSEYNQVDFHKIKKSLEYNGWDKDKPVFCLRFFNSYYVLNGHHRLRAAMLLNFNKAYCLSVDGYEANSLMENEGMDRGMLEDEARSMVGLN